MNRLRVAVYVALVLAAAGMLRWVEYRYDQSLDRIEAEADARAVTSCESANETRGLLRQISREVGVASGVAGGEALILTAGDAEPAVIDAYRRNLVDQLGPALDDIVNQLPDRAWEAGECVDVPVEP